MYTAKSNLIINIFINRFYFSFFSDQFVRVEIRIRVNNFQTNSIPIFIIYSAYIMLFKLKTSIELWKVFIIPWFFRRFILLLFKTCLKFTESLRSRHTKNLILLTLSFWSHLSTKFITSSYRLPVCTYFWDCINYNSNK